jgi:peptide-methionine (R)-S-oxide reductase
MKRNQKLQFSVVQMTSILVISFFCQCSNAQISKQSKTMSNPYYSRTDSTKLKVTDAEWKKILPDEVYKVARLKGTEYAFSGKYYQTNTKGMYYCAVCGNPLFKSDAKFASSCGWPSFFETIKPHSVTYQDDQSYGMERTEVNCGRCGSHLGHIFDDGPAPTHKRYCMNSIVLEFEPDAAAK